MVTVTPAGIDLREFGSGVGVGNGQADTDALTAAWRHIADATTAGTVNATPSDQYGISGSALLLPPCSITYEGPGLSDAAVPQFTGRFVIRGAGAGMSEVRLTPGNRLIDIAAAALSRFELADFQVRGGEGVFRHQRTANNIFGDLAFRRLVLIGYTGCAIEFNSQNMPYVAVESSTFRGADAATTMGVALPDLANGSRITGNRFLLNRVHVKLRRGGNDVYLDGNDWLRFTPTRPAGPCVDMWLVPAPPPFPGSGAGCGTHLTRSNKLGNENFQPGDFKVLAAGETVGATNGVRWPVLDAPAGGYLEGATVHPTVYGASTAIRSPVYSMCPNLYAWDVDIYHRGSSSLPDYVVEFANPAAPSADPVSRSTSSVTIRGAGVGTYKPVAASNATFTAQ